MKRNVVLALGVLVLGICPCSASPLLSLSSSATDLNNLVPGQSVVFQVALAEMNPGQELEFLAVTIRYDELLLSRPSIHGGPIVPDATGFLQLEDAGLADASYDALFAVTGSRIASNGVFFAFQTTVLQSGAGRVGFQFSDALEFNRDEPGNPLPPDLRQGPDLSFVIAPAAVVPEPCSLMLLSVGLGALGMAACRRAAWC